MASRPDPRRAPKRQDAALARRSASPLGWLRRLLFSPLRLVRQGHKLRLTLSSDLHPSTQREPPPRNAWVASWRALRRLFFSPLGLDRQQRKSHVALKAEGTPALVTQEPQPSHAQAQLLSAMQGELKTLLNQRSETRSVLRQLAVLEAQLRRDGLGAFDGMPLELLGRALEQLESLSADLGTPGLAALHSRLQLALLKREQAVPPADRGNDFLSDFGVGQKVLVNEVTPSNFDTWRSTLEAPDQAQGSAPASTSEPRE